MALFAFAFLLLASPLIFPLSCLELVDVALPTIQNLKSESEHVDPFEMKE